MRNLCQIFSKKSQKIGAFVLIVSLSWGMAPTSESISVKLRGKIALAGILSGLAYTTHVLVTRDRRAMEKLQLRLGPPDRVVQFERGFDVWHINYYRGQSYMFRNNRFIKMAPSNNRQSKNRDYRHQTHICNCKFTSPFLIDMPVSRNPKWLQLCPLHPQRAPQFGSSCLYRLAAERLLGPQLWLSR